MKNKKYKIIGNCSVDIFHTGVEDDINEEPDVIELDKPFACYCYGGS